MDEDRFKGVGKQATGSIKEATGKVIGNTKAQAEGARDMVRDTVQE